jgi:hypothetical protein
LLEVPHCHEELVHIDPTCGQGTRRVTDKASTSAIRKVGTRRTRVVRVEHFEEEGHLVLDATSSLSCSVLVLEWKEPPCQRTRKRQREHEGERRRENEKARTEKGEEERATGEPLWPSVASSRICAGRKPPVKRHARPYKPTIQNLFAALFGPFGQAVPQLAHVCHWAIMPVWQHV